MTDQQLSSEYVTSLTTEHLTLQQAMTATISEAGNRATLYTALLSSTLVALGFTAGDKEVFPLLAGAMIPVVFVLGLLTVVRLADTSIENLGYQERIRRIHELYATLAPGGDHNFPTGNGARNDAQTAWQVRHRFPYLTTMATLVGAANAIVGGIAVAYVLGGVLAVPLAGAVVCGLVVAVGLFVLTVVYQHARGARARPVWHGGSPE